MHASLLSVETPPGSDMTAAVSNLSASRAGGTEPCRSLRPRHVHAQPTRVALHGDSPRPAAHGAVLDERARGVRVDIEIDPLATVRATNVDRVLHRRILARLGRDVTVWRDRRDHPADPRRAAADDSSTAGTLPRHGCDTREVPQHRGARC